MSAGGRWLPDPDFELQDGQRAFAEELERALVKLAPARLDREGVEVALTDGGDLYVRLPHQSLEVAIECFVTERRAVVSVDPVSQVVDARVFRDPERRRAATVGFIAALLSGFERRVRERDGRTVRVELRVPQPSGRPHRLRARVRMAMGPTDERREWISFLAEGEDAANAGDGPVEQPAEG